MTKKAINYKMDVLGLCTLMWKPRGWNDYRSGSWAD